MPALSSDEYSKIRLRAIIRQQEIRTIEHCYRFMSLHHPFQAIVHVRACNELRNRYPNSISYAWRLLLNIAFLRIVSEEKFGLPFFTVRMLNQVFNTRYSQKKRSWLEYWEMVGVIFRDADFKKVTKTTKHDWLRPDPTNTFYRIFPNVLDDVMADYGNEVVSIWNDIMDIIDSQPKHPTDANYFARRTKSAKRKAENLAATEFVYRALQEDVCGRIVDYTRFGDSARAIHSIGSDFRDWYATRDSLDLIDRPETFTPAVGAAIVAAWRSGERERPVKKRADRASYRRQDDAFGESDPDGRQAQKRAGSKK